MQTQCKTKHFLEESLKFGEHIYKYTIYTYYKKQYIKLDFKDGHIHLQIQPIKHVISFCVFVTAMQYICQY